MIYKQCRECLIEFPANTDFFYTHKDNKLISYCKGCSTKITTINRRKRVQKARENSICYDCKIAINSNKLRCIKCNKKHSQTMKRIGSKRNQNKLCQKCGSPCDKKICVSCLEIYKEQSKQRRLERRLAGLCKDIQVGITYCLGCWFRATSSRVLGTTKLTKELRQLLDKQEWKCAYTGKFIYPGENASIDHILPISRGGSKTDINNIQWIDIKVNILKNNTTHEEFLDLCRTISARFPV